MSFPTWLKRVPMSCGFVMGSAAFMLTALPACSTNNPAEPTLRSITGHVVLRGYFIDASGRPAGTRVVADADGVRIDLARGNRVIASTTTVDGIYRFSGLSAGVYIARTIAIGGIHDSTEALTIAVANVAVADTLRMYSRGDLYPVPNPFVDSTTVYFDVPNSAVVQVTIRDLAGNLVRSLIAEGLPAGLQQVTWDGRDDQGAMAPGPIHWMVYESGDDLRAHLLFR